MLTEDEALALFLRHCEPLRKAQWCCMDIARRRCWADTARERVDLMVRPSGAATTEKESQRDGARLRLALGVVQAVSCCRGFEPALRLPFWRRVVNSWLDVDLPEGFALSPMAFAHVAVTWSGRRPVDDAFWIGFLHGTPASEALLLAVVNKLSPHLASAALPPLRITLSRCIARDPTSRTDESPRLPFTVQSEAVVVPTALRTILRACLASPTHPWTAATQLGLVVEYRVGVDLAATTEETLCLLTRAHRKRRPHLQLTIARLAIQLAPHKLPRRAVPGRANLRAFVVRVRALGQLLRVFLVDATLQQVEIVALFGCSHTDFRLVGAALSAVAWAVHAPELRCSGLLDASRSQHDLMRLAWLVYALETRRRRAVCPLRQLALVSHGSAVDARECAYMQQFAARGTPLRDVVGETLRLRVGGDDAGVARLRVACLRVGSTVRLARGTPLYAEPMRAAELFVVATLSAFVDEELDLVAHVADHDGFVGVVYAGYGLVWAAVACVLEWQRIEEHEAEDVAMVGDEALDGQQEGAGIGSTLSSLALLYVDGGAVRPAQRPLALRVTGLVTLLASASITSLSIDRAVIQHDDLALVLDYLPALKTLVLDRCVVESLEPLYEAQRPRRRARVASLSLLGVRDLRLAYTLFDYPISLQITLTGRAERGDAPAWLTQFVTAIARGDSSLRELRVDIRAMSSERDERGLLDALARAVASAALPLTRLHVTCNDVDTCAALLAPLQDAELVLAELPRARHAILSVLRQWHCASPGIVHTALELAKPRCLRTITWDGMAYS